MAEEQQAVLDLPKLSIDMLKSALGNLLPRELGERLTLPAGDVLDKLEELSGLVGIEQGDLRLRMR